MLSKSAVVGFIPTNKPTESKEFYRDVLGLSVLSEDDFALVLNCNGTTIRVTRVGKFTPHPFTILGWSVASVQAEVITLKERGVVFQRFEGLDQDNNGIWTAPGGSQIAWFRDPDGNLVSISGDVS